MSFVHELLQDQALMVTGSLFSGLTIGFSLLFRWQRWREQQQQPSIQSPILMQWDQQHAYHVSQLLDGGLLALGRTGSGKTSSLRYLAKGILRQPNSSLLILCPKPGDSQEWLDLIAQAGRSDDVIHLHPGAKHRFNMIQHEAQRMGAGAGQSQNITRFIMDLRSNVLREQDSPGGDSLQWIKQDERGIKNAVTLLLLAKQPITPTNLQQIFLTAPQALSDLETPAWREGFCNQCFAAAFNRTKTTTEVHDYEQTDRYFLHEWPLMADRTRGSILTGIMSILDIMASGLCRELFFSETNFNPTDCLATGKIVLVDYPPDEYGDLGMVANLGLKSIWQKTILRRSVTPETPIAVIWGDESSLWFSKQDVEFLSRCRQSRGALVYLSQSRASYQAILPGQQAEALVNSLLANFSHKLLFALGDYETAEWAANLCGKELENLGGGSVQHANPQEMSFFGAESQLSSNFHEQYEYLVRPELFMNGLRTGGLENQRQVDAILVRSGVPFQSGHNVLPVTFTQEQWHVTTTSSERTSSISHPVSRPATNA